MNVLLLPDEVLEKVLSFMSYDEVSRNRIICRRVNFLAKRVLNRGFYKAERYLAYCLRQVKSQLPRRESERRKHPLARHCDILTSVETRLSLLGMTYVKFIELNLCCFIPGKVLDEMFKVLRYVQTEQTPVRAHEVLQELRDLSSMAMEHFDEKISPGFQKQKETGPKISITQSTISIFDSTIDRQAKPGPSHHKNVDRRSHKWKEALRKVSQKQSIAKREILFLKQKVTEMHRSNAALEKKILELQTLLGTQVEKIKEQDLKLEYLNTNVKFKSSKPSTSIDDSINSDSNEIIMEVLPATSETPHLQRTRRLPTRHQPGRAKKKFRHE